MPSRQQPLKYLVCYPFSVITVAKTFILVIYGLTICVWQWKQHAVGIGLALFIVPIIDLLGCAAALISLWFMVQKFYWKNVEMGFNSSGLALTVFATCTALFAGADGDPINNYIVVNHLLVATAWSFCLFWCRIFTWDNVSNLFINEWGSATEDIEIEALEHHF